MKKLIFAIGLFSAQLAYAGGGAILGGVAPVGDFIPEAAGSPVVMETVLPVWTQVLSTTATPVPAPGTGNVYLVNAGTIKFNVYNVGTNTVVRSTPVKSFPDPREACGLTPSQYNQGNQGGGSDPKFVKTSGSVFVVGQNRSCQKFALNAMGNPTWTDITYPYVYITNLANKKAWLFPVSAPSGNEELVGLSVIPDQSGIPGGAEEVSMSFHSKTAYGHILRVLLVDSATGGVLSNKNYSIGNPD